MQNALLNQEQSKKPITGFFPSPDVMRAMPLGAPRTLPNETDTARNLLLEAARSALADAEERLRLQDERIRHLEGLVLTDDLTGIINRRGFMSTMQRELTTAHRDLSNGGVLMMIDLDGFKSINDSWGHSAGDEYLRVAAQTLQSCVRSNDYVARLGGDEFAVILTRINKKNGLIRAQEIERDFNCQVVEWNKAVVPLRASFGMSFFNGKKSAADIMAEADMRLYENKALRRR